MRALTNHRQPIDPIPQVETYPVSLNPYAWPPCRHCGGNVYCEAYDPDTDAPLWGEEEVK